MLAAKPDQLVAMTGLFVLIEQVRILERRRFGNTDFGILNNVGVEPGILLPSICGRIDRTGSLACLLAGWVPEA